MRKKPSGGQWDGLSRPDTSASGKLCSVEVRNRQWTHVIEKHFLNPYEPWKRFLGESFLLELKRIAKGIADAEQAKELCQRLRDFFEPWVRQTMTFPRVLVFREWNSVWLLLLPTGAKMIVNVHQKTAFFSTVFFPAPHALEPDSELRWSSLLKTLVCRYGLHRADRKIEAPSDTHEVVTGRGNKVVTQIQFITLNSWGFDCSISPAIWNPRLVPHWHSKPVDSPGKWTLPLEPRISK